MTWREQDHPREENGQFTFKNGGKTSSNKEKPKDILYQKSSKQKEIETIKQKRKNELLDTLKDKATPADILYGDEKSLSKKIKEIGLNGKMTGGASGICEPRNNKTFTPISELYKKHPELKPKKEKIDNRILSQNALKKARSLIKGEEKFRAEAYYPTKNDKLTIGYGHTKNVKLGDKITQEEAEKLFEQDLSEHNEILKHVKVRLSENEKAALSSLIYNIGGTAFYKSDLLKKLNAGDKKGAANEFDVYTKQKGIVLNGLVKRRKLEKELFLTPDEE